MSLSASMLLLRSRLLVFARVCSPRPLRVFACCARGVLAATHARMHESAQAHVRARALAPSARARAGFRRARECAGAFLSCLCFCSGVCVCVSVCLSGSLAA
eukprot:12626478-Alexandrium_andersonii.AAC.1